MTEPTIITDLYNENNISTLKHYLEARLNLESSYIESLKDYFDISTKLLFDKIKNLEDDNTTLRKEIEILKDETSTKFNNLAYEIDRLSNKFENLKL